MKSPGTTAQTHSMVFVVLFLLAAFAFTLWTMSRIPDNAMLHINHEWAVILVGEKNTNNIKLTPRFQVEKIDNASIHFSGYGTFNWMGNKITVRRGQISLNGLSVAKSRREKIAHVMFYPDGRLTKGKLQ